MTQSAVSSLASRLVLYVTERIDKEFEERKHTALVVLGNGCPEKMEKWIE